MEIFQYFNSCSVKNKDYFAKFETYFLSGKFYQSEFCHIFLSILINLFIHLGCIMLLHVLNYLHSHNTYTFHNAFLLHFMLINLTEIYFSLYF